ncbi:sulfatase-like hydrolase/transferase [Verrucomicrobiota bacterium]
MLKKLNILIALLLGGTCSFAGVSVVSGPQMVSDDATTGHMTFASVSVQAGDVVAIASAPDKDAAFNPLSLQWSGNEGGDGTSFVVRSANLSGRASYVFYVQIASSGTYTFDVVPANSSLTAQSTLFVLRSDSGAIEVANTQTLAQNTGAPGLGYTFSGSVSGAVAIEAFASKDGKDLTVDAAYTAAQNAGGRFTLYSTSVSGTSWSKTHTCVQGAQDFTGAGAVFIEKDVSPQPPTFDSDPVVEIGAVLGMAYNSTLSDDVSDPNNDPLTFSLVPGGPAWLSLAANGGLSGTPSADDVGTNSWTVSVADGVSGSATATLEIVVGAGGQISQTNFVFFVIDDLGWMDLACQGSGFYETPNIDRLAAEGMRFTQGYASHPRCLPSRYGILTGKFPGANGVPGGPESCLCPADYTVGEALQAGEYITDRLTDEALDWMQYNADKPFFLYFSHYGVHTPFEAPQALVDKYTAKLTTMDYGDLPEYINAGVGQQKMRQDHAIYAAMIESVDQSVGRVLDKLDELGIAGNTVIMFTSDNGGLSNRGGYNGRELATSNYPLRTGKGWLYGGGIREPFIVKWQGVTAAGVISEAVVNGTDFYPTMLEIAGLPLLPNEHQDGVSFVPALKGESFDRGKPIFWHSPLSRPYSTGDFKSSAVREGDYKLIWFYDTPGHNYELYNLKTDVGENIDLSEAMPAKAAELLGKIQAWHNGAHDGLGVIFNSNDNNAVAKPPQAWRSDPSVPPKLHVRAGVRTPTWDDWTGYDYNVLYKTNLSDQSWATLSSRTSGTNLALPVEISKGFLC